MVEMTQLEEDCKKLDSWLTVLYEINDLDLHELDLDGLVILLKNILSLMNDVLVACDITPDKIYLFTAAVHHFNKATKGTVEKLNKNANLHGFSIETLNGLNKENQKFFKKFMRKINDGHKTDNDQQSLFSHENAIKDDVNPLPTCKDELRFYEASIKDVGPKWLHAELIKLMNQLPSGLNVKGQLAYIASHIAINSACYGLFLLRCPASEFAYPAKFALPKGLKYVTDHWFKLDDSEYYYQVVKVTKPLTKPVSINLNAELVVLKSTRSQDGCRE